MRQNNNGNIDHAVLSPRSGTALPSEHGSIFRQEAEKLLETEVSAGERKCCSPSNVLLGLWNASTQECLRPGAWQVLNTHLNRHLAE